MRFLFVFLLCVFVGGGPLFAQQNSGLETILKASSDVAAGLGDPAACRDIMQNLEEKNQEIKDLKKELKEKNQEVKNLKKELKNKENEKSNLEKEKNEKCRR